MDFGTTFKNILGTSFVFICTTLLKFNLGTKNKPLYQEIAGKLCKYFSAVIQIAQSIFLSPKWAIPSLYNVEYMCRLLIILMQSWVL